MFYSFARAVLTPILHLIFNLKYEGIENLKSEGGYLICSNHRSFWDPLLIAFGERKRSLKFMAKKELFSFKPFGKIISSLGAFPVNRGSGDIGAVKNAIEVVNEGNILLIFPEGTRSKTGKLLRAKSGAAYIASEANADIVPVAICFEGKKLSFRKKVVVCYGKAIKSEEIPVSSENRTADAKKAVNLVMDRISQMIDNHISAPCLEEK